MAIWTRGGNGTRMCFVQSQATSWRVAVCWKCQVSLEKGNEGQYLVDEDFGFPIDFYRSDIRGTGAVVGIR